MSITLRAEKQQPLSFEELDKNFCSFYFSSSLFTDNQQNNYLRLWYTGSEQVGDTGEFNIRYDQYPLGGSGSSITNQSAGNKFEVQYSNGQGDFIADSSFVKTSIGVGINKPEPQELLHIKSTSSKDGVVKLDCRATSTQLSTQSSKAYLQIAQGGVPISELGKVYLNSNDTFFHSIPISSQSERPALRFNNTKPFDSQVASALTIRDNRIGIKHNSPNKELSVIGEIGIGSTANTNSNQNTLTSLNKYGFNNLINNNYNQTLTILPPEKGGNVGIGLLNAFEQGPTSFVIGSSSDTTNFELSESKKVFEVQANGVTTISDILKINPITSLPNQPEIGMVAMLLEGQQAVPYYYSGTEWINILTGESI